MEENENMENNDQPQLVAATNKHHNLLQPLTEISLLAKRRLLEYAASYWAVWVSTNLSSD